MADGSRRRSTAASGCRTPRPRAGTGNRTRTATGSTRRMAGPSFPRFPGAGRSSTTAAGDGLPRWAGTGFPGSFGLPPGFRGAIRTDTWPGPRTRRPDTGTGRAGRDGWRFRARTSPIPSCAKSFRGRTLVRSCAARGPRNRSAPFRSEGMRTGRRARRCGRHARHALLRERSAGSELTTELQREERERGPRFAPSGPPLPGAFAIGGGSDWKVIVWRTAVGRPSRIAGVNRQERKKPSHGTRAP